MSTEENGHEDAADACDELGVDDELSETQEESVAVADAETQPAAEDDSQFKSRVLHAHNELRAEHGSEPLALCAELDDMAQRHAEHLAKCRFMTYLEHPNTGENVTFFPAKFGARECMHFWISERERYNFKKAQWQQGTNYFTQIVWASTRSIGIGRAMMDHPTEPQCIVVCLYRPTGNGNRPGEFAQNVRKPLSFAEESEHENGDGESMR